MKNTVKPRPTIAVLGDHLFSSYEGPIWAGISKTAQSLDANLLSFAGSILQSWYKNKAHNLVNKTQIDGIIAFSNTIVNTSSKDKMADFLRLFAPLPIVCISLPIEDLPSVMVNNQSGMKQLVDHFIEVHHHSRIAFIKGPAEHGEANARFEGYLESLTQHDIPFDPQLIYPGDFNWSCGAAAIQCFLDDRKVAFDAVIGCNDYAALYAMNELQRRGFKVPADVAVGGFDGIREAFIATPAISTVRQPLEAIGREAVIRILSCIRGEAPDTPPLPTTLVIRQSCGCISENRQQMQSEIAIEPVGEESFGIPASERLDKNFPDISEKVGTTAWSNRLIQSFCTALTGTPETFLNELGAQIMKGIENNLAIPKWYKVLQTLFQTLKQDHQGNWENYIDLVEDSYELIGTLSLKAQIIEQMQIEDINKSFQRIQRDINGNLEVDPINRQILEHLSQLGVESFFLSRYVKEQELAELFCHFNRKESLQVDLDTPQYPPRNLYPGHFLQGSKRYSFIIWPIMEYGFAVCDVLCLEGSIKQSETISRIGETVKNVFLINIVKRYAEELEIKVEERTKELKEAHQQLVDVAHQAGMAEMSIGVMHNIGNLLNSVSISSEIIQQTLNHSKINGLAKANQLMVSHQDHLAEFFAHDEKAKLLPDYYRAVGDGLMDENAKLKYEIAQSAENIALIRAIISDLQEYALEKQKGVLEELLRPDEVIETALKLQESHIDEKHISILKEYKVIHPVPIQRTKLIHILINLIKNAIEAMEEVPFNNRRLSIRLWESQDKILIDLSDNGMGISEDNLKKIFVFGFTTKPNGHGFGLHTCANHMKEMGGSIEVYSEGLGKGAAFTLVLPIKTPA